jgi:hypothetical protein
MSLLIQSEHSECCNAFVRLNTDPPTDDIKKGIYYFNCAKCGKPCHIKKKHR